MNITVKKMKQAFIILSLLAVIGCSKSQVTSGYLGVIVPDSVGNIFNVTFNASSGSLFTRTGSSGTWTYGTGLSISGAGTNAPDNFIEYTGWYTDLEKNSTELIFTPTSDGNGIGIGYIGSNSRYYYGRIILSGASKGQLRFESVISGTVTNRVNSGATLFTVTNGDQHKLTLTRTPTLITLTILNTVTNATQTLNYTISYITAVDFDSYKVGREAIIWYGGSQTVTSFRYSSPIVKNPKILFTGDSNMAGAFAGSDANRYSKKLDSAVVARIEVLAGGGNASGDIVNLLPEILLINPQAVLVNIGTNGIQQSDINKIRDTLTAHSIKVYLSTIFPNASGVNAGNSIVRGESGVTLIDLDATLLNGGSVLYPGYDHDGVHINQAGNAAVYTKLLSDLSTYLSSP